MPGIIRYSGCTLRRMAWPGGRDKTWTGGEGPQQERESDSSHDIKAQRSAEWQRAIKTYKRQETDMQPEIQREKPTSRDPGREVERHCKGQ